MSDQDEISPYIIDTILSKKREYRTKYINYGINCYLIQYKIIRTDFVRIVWQTVRRIANEILGVKGLKSPVKECCQWQ